MLTGRWLHADRGLSALVFQFHQITIIQVPRIEVRLFVF